MTSQDNESPPSPKGGRAGDSTRAVGDVHPLAMGPHDLGREHQVSGTDDEAAVIKPSRRSEDGVTTDRRPVTTEIAQGATAPPCDKPGLVTIRPRSIRCKSHDSNSKQVDRAGGSGVPAPGPLYFGDATRQARRWSHDTNLSEAQVGHTLVSGTISPPATVEWPVSGLKTAVRVLGDPSNSVSYPQVLYNILRPVGGCGCGPENLGLAGPAKRPPLWPPGRT